MERLVWIALQKREKVYPDECLASLYVIEFYNVTDYCVDLAPQDAKSSPWASLS